MPWASYFSDSYTVKAIVNGNSIEVSWTSDDQLFQQQLQSVQVIVTSGCLTGTGVPRTRVFTVTPSEGNSVNITGLGNNNIVTIMISLWVLYLMQIFLWHITSMSVVLYVISVWKCTMIQSSFTKVVRIEFIVTSEKRVASLHHSVLIYFDSIMLIVLEYFLQETLASP